jgi:hypothetical protein
MILKLAFDDVMGKRAEFIQGGRCGKFFQTGESTLS